MKITSIWNFPLLVNETLYYIKIKGLSKPNQFENIVLEQYNLRKAAVVSSTEIPVVSDSLLFSNFQMQYVSNSIYLNFEDTILKYDTDTSKFETVQLQQENLDTKYAPEIYMRETYIADDTVYFHEKKERKNRFVAAYDLASGSINWKIGNIENPIQAIQGYEDYIFIRQDQKITCLHRENGHELWSFLIDDKFKIKFEQSSKCTIDSPIIIKEEKLIFSVTNGYVIFLNLSTGKLLHKLSFEALHMSALRYLDAHQKLYVFANNTFYSINLQGEIVLEASLTTSDSKQLELLGSVNMTVTEKKAVLQDINSSTIFSIDISTGKLLNYHQLNLEGSIPLGSNPIVYKDTIIMHFLNETPQLGGVLQSISLTNE